MKLWKSAVFFALSTLSLLAQTTAPSGMYWPTGSSTNTSQIFSDQPMGFAGNWLEPGCIFSLGSCTDYRDIEDPSTATEVGAYFNNEYHLGFDILNLSDELHHPIYAVADGQVMRVSYSGWGATLCTEIEGLYTSYTMPSCSQCPSGYGGSNGTDGKQCTSNVGLVIKHIGPDSTPYYVIYGHLFNLSQTPRSMPGATFSSTEPSPNVCSSGNYLTTSTTGVETADLITLDQKRQFEACDIILAGELLGYTGDWINTRHLHFGVAPYTLPTSPLGLTSYTATDWPSGQYTPTGDYVAPTGSQTLGNYYNLTNPIAYINDSSNIPDNWIQGVGIGVAPATTTQGSCISATTWDDYGIVTSMATPPALSMVNGLPTLTFTGTITNDGGNTGYMAFQVDPYPSSCSTRLYGGFNLSAGVGTHTVAVSYDYQNQILSASLDGGTPSTISTGGFESPLNSVAVCVGYLGCNYGSTSPDFTF